ncbi:MAG: terpene cyclase/mutase family protein [Planctomycetes bacterium]|nr:terpene cyclase/mutase family protein [Planctomycetota bacterium]
MNVRADKRMASHKKLTVLLAFFGLLAATLSIGPSVRAADGKTSLASSVERAINFLATTRAEDGSYSSHAGTGVTSLVTTALMRHGRSPQDPMIANSLAYLEKNIRRDGGIYQKGSRYRNYETCLAILCFQTANRDGRYSDLLAKAESFVKGIQWDGDEGHDRSSTSFGGAGYGKHNRPDMSNTTFLIDALNSLGRGADDPAIQRALVFVSRCQNLETEHNDTKFAAANPDGGFYYTVAAGGTSQAGETASGGLRSYGSMTYAGLKSMIYAGVGPDDPRVKAAFTWASKNYTVHENPGMGTSGLFYYYHTFAKALDAIGEESIVDKEGVAHDWRQELIDEIVSRQLENGSWLNENERWLEGDPSLVTGYVLLTLSYCRGD